MQKQLFRAAAITALLMSFGCAYVPLASRQADREAKLFAVKPGLANIYIYRLESVGAALEIPLAVDGVAVGRTSEDTFTVIQVHPGRHTVISKAEKDTALDVVAAPDQNVFVWQEVVPGFRRARTNLHLIDAQVAMKQIKKTRLIER